MVNVCYYCGAHVNPPKDGGGFGKYGMVMTIDIKDTAGNVVRSIEKQFVCQKCYDERAEKVWHNQREQVPPIPVKE